MSQFNHHLFWLYYPLIAALGGWIIAMFVTMNRKEEKWWLNWLIFRFQWRLQNLIYFVGFLALIFSHWIWELFAATNYVVKVPVYGFVALLIFVVVGYFDYKFVDDHEKM